MIIRTLLMLVFLLSTSAMALEEMPVSQELEPMNAPGTIEPGYIWEAVDEDGDPYSIKLISLEDNNGTWENNKGCRWTIPFFSFAPSLKWSNCPGGATKGSQTINDTKGNPWPLSNDTKFSYEVSGLGGGYSWNTTRRCEVVDQVRVKVPAGEFDTYKVFCKDSWNERTYWVSPELQELVAFKQYHVNDRKRRHTYELVKIIEP